MKKGRFWVATLLLVMVTCLIFGLIACSENNRNNDGELWSIERVYALAQENGFEGTLEDFITMFKGEQGEKGEQGDKGDKGEQGLDGIGIKSAYIDERGHLILVLADDTEIDAGEVKAENTESPYTEGLSYQATLKWGKKSYIVSGVGLVAEYNIVIPETFNGCPVIGIMHNAFENNTYIRSISIPDSVTEIGSHAFAGCTAEIVWGDNPSITRIYPYAFAEYEGESIAIPDSVTEISDYAFYKCSSKSITIPDSVIRIGECAFDSTLHYDNNWASWENGVLYIGKHLIKAISRIPEEYSIKADTLTIAKRAFFLCDNLKSVVISGSIKFIPFDAFASCKNLTNVTFGSGVEEIFACAFYGNPNLTTITIPNSIIWIRVWAFAECSKLTDIYFNGTQAQWDEVIKEKEWDCDNANTSNAIQRSYKVHCTDGEIQVN